MSDESKDTGAPASAPLPAKEGDALTGSIGLSEGYRGIDIVNVAPVSGVPSPGGLPPAGNPGAGGTQGEAGASGPTSSAAPAESSPPPASSGE
jgi:hypothetical protein